MHRIPILQKRSYTVVYVFKDASEVIWVCAVTHISAHKKWKIEKWWKKKKDNDVYQLRLEKYTQQYANKKNVIRKKHKLLSVFAIK